MPKFTLTCEHEYDGLKTTTEFREEFLPDVLENIELFLRGAGYFFDGKLDFIEDTEYLSEDEPDTSNAFEQVVNDHMNFLDTKRNDLCSVCGLPSSVMQGQKCYAENCPKKAMSDAN